MFMSEQIISRLLVPCAALLLISSLCTAQPSAQPPLPPPIPGAPGERAPYDPAAMNDRDPTDCPSPEDAQGQFKELSAIRVALQVEGKELPPDCSQHVFEGMRRSAPMRDSLIEFGWAPANFFHRPLYFEDVPLERYGQSVCPHLQPILSGGRFFLTFPILPYKIGADHPHDCVTTLGYYRPGICAPCVMQVPPPLEWDAALLEAGAAVGLVLLLP